MPSWMDARLDLLTWESELTVSDPEEDYYFGDVEDLDAAFRYGDNILKRDVEDRIDRLQQRQMHKHLARLENELEEE